MGAKGLGEGVLAKEPARNGGVLAKNPFRPEAERLRGGGAAKWAEYHARP